MAKPFTIVVILLLAGIAVANCQKKSNSTAVASKDSDNDDDDDDDPGFIADTLDEVFNFFTDLVDRGPLSVILKPIGFILLIITTPLRGINGIVHGIDDGVESLIKGIGGVVMYAISDIRAPPLALFKFISLILGEGTRRRRALTNSSAESSLVSSGLLGGVLSWLKGLLPLLDSYLVKLKDNALLPTEISSLLGTIHSIFTAIYMLGLI